jgi:hypothetical protein
MRRDLRQRVFAAAEADFQPQRPRAGCEGGQRIAGLIGTQRQPRQRDVEQAALARPQRVAAAAAIQTVGGRLEVGKSRDQRPNAAFRAGTRSVFSQVKVPFSSSGSRPKCP